MKRSIALCFVALGLACARESAAPVAFRAIESVCVDAPAGVPAGAWTCGEHLVVDCNQDELPAEIFVPVEAGVCEDLDLQEVPGPFGVGDHPIAVVDGPSGDTVCTATLTVVDPVAPIVEVNAPTLWPPNHKLHTIDLIDDCIAEVLDCDPDWVARIDYVTGDEPDDDRGDGHTVDDAVITSERTVSLRAERQGGGNGRVYTIGFTVEDSSGNVTEAACQVSVAHDQGRKGAAVDDGEQWRIEP